VLLAAKTKLAAAFWLPDVRLAAAVYWYTFFVPLSTIQMSLTLLGLIVNPVGDEFAMSMVQLPSKLPDMLSLNTLSVVLSSTTQNGVPSVTMPLPLSFLFFPLVRLKLLAALWLPESRLAAPVYL